MFGYMLFFHLTSLVLWAGSLVAITILLLLAKRQLKSEDTKTLVRKAIRTFSWIAHPSSIIVLVSGIFMIIEMNYGETAKPFWLVYMERGGGMIVLVAIVMTAVLGRKAIKRLSTGNKSAVATATGPSVASPVYLTSLILLVVAILSVVLVVSLRL